MSLSQVPQTHASLDIASRKGKARKIFRLLGLDSLRKPLRVLEIGCGSGVIANYFSVHLHGGSEVIAVDVVDQRIVKEGYRFQQVSGVELPFEDAWFDLVISNHVIEHVGEIPEQLTHLTEIRRVLKPGCCAYLATPSRWMPIEPHYCLMFLSWLPVPLRSFYVRQMGKGEYYDCHPRSAAEIEKLCAAADLRTQSLVAEALRELAVQENRKFSVLDLVAALPRSWLSRLAGCSPTLIYRLDRGLNNRNDSPVV